MAQNSIFTRSGVDWNETVPGKAFVRNAGSWEKITSLWVRNANLWENVWLLFVGRIHPDSDIDTSGWTATPLFEKLDEVTPDDATTEITSLDFNNSSSEQVHDFEVALSNPTITPTGQETITWRVRHWLEEVFGSVSINNVTLQLKQGATVIATLLTSGNLVGYSTNFNTLSQAQKNNITDWTDLRFRVSYSIQVTSEGDEAIAHVTWIELEFS